MKRLLVLLAVMLAAVAATAPTALAAGECPTTDGGNPGVKVESGSAGNDVVLPAGTRFCVKASNDNTGILTADGETSLIEYVEQAGIVNEQGEPHDVSHYWTYTAVGTTGEETTGEETTGEETTGEETTGEETTGEETTGEETTGEETTGEETTGGEGAAGGGGGGGEAVGETPAEESSGALPFTGFPMWIIALAGLGLVGAGLAFWRAARSTR